MKANFKFRIFSLVLFMGMLLLCGACKDYTSIDDQCYALALGIDATQNDDEYSFTILVPNLGATTEEAKNSGQSYETLRAKDVYEAADLFNVSMPWHVNYLHTNYIVVNTKLAQSERMETILTQARDFLKLRESNVVLVSTTTAQSFLSGLSNSMETNYAKMQKTMELESDMTGLYPTNLLGEYFEAVYHKSFDALIPLGAFNFTAADKSQIKKDELDSISESQGSSGGSGGGSSGSGESGGAQGGATPPPKTDQEQIQELQQQIQDLQKKQDITQDNITAGTIDREGGMRSEILGAAIFDGPKMVGMLTGVQSQYAMLARNSFDEGTIGFDAFLGTPDETEIFAKLSKRKGSKIKVDIKSDPMTIDGTLYIDAQVATQSAEANKRLKNDLAFKDQVRELLREHITKSVSEVVKKCQEKNSDVAALGRYVIQKFPTIQKWNEFDWKRKYPEFQINWTVDVRLVNARQS